MQAVLVEIRQLSASSPRQLGNDAPAWPLEDVTRLHQQLRETTSGARALAPAPMVSSPQLSLTGSAPIETDHHDARPDGEWLVPPEATPARSRPFPRRVGIAIAAVLIVVGGLLVWRLQHDLRAATARAEQSQAESRAAAETATRQAAQRQDAAARQLVAAQDLAARAQTIGDVLAASDLVRYTLASPGGLQRATGQVLWSRSRGFVFSASGLTAPPPGATYQVWMLVRGGALSAGTFEPDAAGRATLTTTPNIPRPVIGAIVTAERKGGAETPVGDLVLTRLPAPAPTE